MLKCTLMGTTGDAILVLGLSQAELAQLRAKEPIYVDGKGLGLDGIPMIMLAEAESEQELRATVEQNLSVSIERQPRGSA